MSAIKGSERSLKITAAKKKDQRPHESFNVVSNCDGLRDERADQKVRYEPNESVLNTNHQIGELVVHSRTLLRAVKPSCVRFPRVNDANAAF